MAKVSPITVEVEIRATTFLGRLLIALPAIGSFLISVALAFALIVLAICAAVEVQHLHRAFLP